MGLICKEAKEAKPFGESVTLLPFTAAGPRGPQKSLSNLQQAGSVEKRPTWELGEAVCRTTAKATATLDGPF